jgi:hypothetical protein
MSTYGVQVIPLGRAEVPGPELFWMGGWGAWYPLLFQAILIRGNGVTALVNTGPPDDLTTINARWEAILGPRAVMRRSEEEFLLPQLANHGVTPGDVTHVLLSPLQLYTVANVLAFPNAQIGITKRGWVQFHTVHEHLHDDRATSIPDEILVHLVTDAWGRVRLLEDEDQIAPGLRTWWSGVHHRASMVIEVDTVDGVAAISDSFFYLENVERGHPMGINESLAEATVVYDRVRRDVDIVVPLYDPKNLERFDKGRIS